MTSYSNGAVCVWCCAEYSTDLLPRWRPERSENNHIMLARTALLVNDGWWLIIIPQYDGIGCSRCLSDQSGGS